MDGPSLFVPLPSASSMRFIETCNNIDNCLDYIRENNGRTFTLFIYSENLRTWLDNGNDIPHNLHEIILFYPPFRDKAYCNAWTNRYPQVKGIIAYDELDRELLFYGTKYVRELSLKYEDDQGPQRLLKEDLEHMDLALIHSLTIDIDRLRDHVIRPSVEEIP
jgi:hypothetical protein